MKRKSLLIMLLVALFVPLAMNAQNSMLKKSKGSVQTKGSVQLEMRASTNETPSNPLLSKLESAKEAALEELNNRAGNRGSSTVTASQITSTSATWTGSEGESWIVAITISNTNGLNQAVTNGYAQFGTQRNYATRGTFSTSGISGTITSVAVDCASYNGNGTVSVTVGGAAFGSSQSIPSWSGTAGGTRTFTGSASGNIVVTMTNGTNTHRAMYIKSITVTYSPAGCSAPTNFAATSTTGTSATLSWTETGTSDTWVVYYMAEDDEESSYEIVDTNPFTLTGLNPVTTYYALVTPYCGDLDQDSEVITFTTADLPCSMPTDLAVNNITTNSATFSWTGEGESYNVQYRTPGGRDLLFYEGFEDGLPNDWTETSVGSNTGVYSGAPNSGTYMYGFARNSTYIQYLITPELNITEEGSVFAFYHMAYTANATIYVGTSSTTTATNQFTWGTAQTVTASTSYDSYAVEIPVGTKYVAIRVNAMSSASDVYYFVDDVMVLGPYVEPGEWHTANNVTSPYTFTGMDPETEYEWQVQAVCGGDDGESLWASASSTFTTLSACAAPTGLSSADITNNSAALSWTGYADTYDIQYREALDPTTPATIILTTTDIWNDGSGYQMLLDADATAYDNYETNGISDYSIFEYLIPTNATYDPNTTGFVLNNSVSIQIPAGTYDFFITNPSPDYNNVYIAASNGNVGGRQNNYVFEAGRTYEFIPSIYGQNDGVDVTITDSGNAWTLVEGEASPYTLTGLNANTQYEWRVQGAGCDNWSACAYFTTLNGILVTDITADDVEVAVGATANITNLEVLPTDATNPAVTYTSNDETVATVTDAGVVTGVAVGTTTITIAATDGSGVTGTCNVTVNGIDVTGITAEDVTMITGETATISYTVAPANATDPSVTFTSANTAIATVDADGAVTGVGVGETTITIASVSNPEVTAEITVTVTSNPNAVQFTVNAPANAHPGDVITVDFMLAAPTTGTYTGFTGLDVNLFFETAAFQYNSKANGAVADAVSAIDMGQVSISGPNTNNPNRVKALLSTPANYPVTTEGIVFSATFTVLQDVTLGSYIFNAEINEFDYTTGVVGNSTTVDIPYEVTPSTVEVAELVTFTKDITAYTETGGFYFIASPVSTTPTDVTNMLSNTYDLYRFNQSAAADNQGITKEWENYKKHQSDFFITPGQGYLYANVNDVTLEFSGTLYNGNGTFDLAYDDNVADAVKGMNLVGNPYPETATVSVSSFYTMNHDDDLVANTGNTVAAMEGIMVVATAADQTVTFTRGNGSKANDQLVLNISQGRGVIDRAIVRFDNDSQLPKFQLFETSTKLYIPQGTQDFAVVNAEAQGEMPVNFKAKNNGTYTVSVNTENVEFNYLHLIDNMTGADIDLLETPSYSFEANTSDYESRFKLVFAKGDNSNSNEFAFISDGNIIVNGEGLLQVIDMTGRVISTSQVSGMSNIKLNAAAGVYVLKLNDKTQKIVVK